MLKNKHFIATFGFALFLSVLGFGLLSFVFIDFSTFKIERQHVVEALVPQELKSTEIQSKDIHRKPNLRDFASLLNTIETAAGEREKATSLAEGVLETIKTEQKQISLSSEKASEKEDNALPKISETGLKKQIINIEKEKATLAPLLPQNEKSKPKIAIVIDDLGLNFGRLRELSTIAKPLNFAFLPYAENLSVQTKYSLKQGHELIVHMPMMPKSKNESLGPIVLDKSMSEKELKKALAEGLASFQGYVGINNHMGSSFTEDKKGMHIVLQELKKRNLFFLDSKTTNDSVGAEVAKEIGLPFLERDVFLDHQATEEFVRKQLQLTERIAKRTGQAIAIGHPYRATIDVLKEWLPTLEEKGFELVTLSSLIEDKKRFSNLKVD